MILDSRFAVLIPARYSSSRFPGKPLAKIGGIPMVVRVSHIAHEVVGRDRVFVATDCAAIAKIVEQHSINVIMTESTHPTGTDRIAEASRRLDFQYIINLQGDEPFVDPADIAAVAREQVLFPEAVVNAYCAISPTEARKASVPKMVISHDGRLLYASRSLVPGRKFGDSEEGSYSRQVCIYSFPSHVLQSYISFGRRSGVERNEDIEILRFLEMGLTKRAVEESKGSVAVDTPDDLLIAEAIMKSRI